ncbi:MAG: Hsp70 family protein, partial [Clostridia bacterium]|nr:Hsp70 family protein [Clostridia bacterium]
FDIDANGIVHVSAKDLGTGKEQAISITASSNMSKEDIDRAVREAEQFAAEDKKRKEDLDTRNNADQMVYQCEKLLQESGDKLSDDDKAKINAGVDALKESLKGEDMNLIKSRQDELTKVFYEISERLYQQAAPNGQPGPDMGGNGGFNGDPGFNGYNGDAGTEGNGGNNDGYYDAPYTEV